MMTKVSSSKVLDAFIEQAYNGNVKQWEQNREEVFNKSCEIHGEWIKEATEMLSRPQEIYNYTEIPTKISQGELDEKPESHPMFKDYDHSLEMDRLPSLRAKCDYVAPETRYEDSSDFTMSTEAYENIDPKEVPNLNGLFDGVFE